MHHLSFSLPLGPLSGRVTADPCFRTHFSENPKFLEISIWGRFFTIFDSCQLHWTFPNAALVGGWVWVVHVVRSTLFRGSFVQKIGAKNAKSRILPNIIEIYRSNHAESEYVNEKFRSFSLRSSKIMVLDENHGF